MGNHLGIAGPVSNLIKCVTSIFIYLFLSCLYLETFCKNIRRRKKKDYWFRMGKKKKKSWWMNDSNSTAIIIKEYQQHGFPGFSLGKSSWWHLVSAQSQCLFFAGQWTLVCSCVGECCLWVHPYFTSSITLPHQWAKVLTEYLIMAINIRFLPSTMSCGDLYSCQKSG